MPAAFHGSYPEAHWPNGVRTVIVISPSDGEMTMNCDGVLKSNSEPLPGLLDAAAPPARRRFCIFGLGARHKNFGKCWGITGRSDSTEFALLQIASIRSPFFRRTARRDPQGSKIRTSPRTAGLPAAFRGSYPEAHWPNGVRNAVVFRPSDGAERKGCAALLLHSQLSLAGEGIFRRRLRQEAVCQPRMQYREHVAVVLVTRVGSLGFGTKRIHR